MRVFWHVQGKKMKVAILPDSDPEVNLEVDLRLLCCCIPAAALRNLAPLVLKHLSGRFFDIDLGKVGDAEGAAAAVALEKALDGGDDDDEWLEETGVWQVRQRSRAVLRLFDCVQCGACRIHGKVAWFGVATALKLIYSDASTRPLCRVEVAALLTTLAKLATAVRFAKEMEEICCEQAAA